MIRITPAQLQARLAQRPPEYLAEIAPALLRTLPDGTQEYDEHHPAWRAALKKYRPLARGLGDTVERVLDATGIGPVAKKIITTVTGKPCGCAKRRDLLNKLVPYTKEQQVALANKDTAK
jgi:hypothetical protein